MTTRPRPVPRSSARRARRGPAPARRGPRSPAAALPAREAIVEAARRALIERGHARVSTRVVAAAAGVNQSLIHYYFGTREKLLLAVLESMNAELLKRQAEMFQSPTAFADKWAQACRFWEQDLASGFVRLMIELQGLGVSEPAIGVEVRRIRGEWRTLLQDVSREALAHFGLRSVSAEVVGAFVTCFWIGMELETMLGVPEAEGHFRESLATVERFLRWLDATTAAGRRPTLE